MRFSKNLYSILRKCLKVVLRKYDGVKFIELINLNKIRNNHYLEGDIMRIYKELPLGVTMMGMSFDEAVKSRKKREKDACWQRVFGSHYRIPELDCL